MGGSFCARNSWRKGGSRPGAGGGLSCRAGAAGPHASVARSSPTASAAARSLRLQVDRREVLMVAVGVEAIDAHEVDAGAGEGEGDARPHTALGLEVEVELPLRHDVLIEIGRAHV